MFINIPNNFASMWGELNFEYSCTDDTDIVIEIINDVTDETIGVKKFYSSSSAKVNVAPLIFDSMLPEATSRTTSGISLPSTGFPRIRVTADSTSSDTLQFTYATEQVQAPSLLTTLPTNRLLYAGESDQVAVAAPKGTALTYKLYCDPISSGTTQYYSSGYGSIDGGARVFTLNADEFNDKYYSATLIFLSDDEEIDRVNYSLSGDSTPGYRVAWLSTQGSIEHYTFPFVAEQSRLSSGGVTKSLRSAYGTAEQIEALSEIVSSSKVWRVDGQSYTPIEVVTTEQIISKDGALSIANIKILENG